jgi:hypothetical protein
MGESINKEAVEAFIRRWQGREGGQQRANYVSFLNELIALLGLPPPDPSRAGRRDVPDAVLVHDVRRRRRAAAGKVFQGSPGGMREEPGGLYPRCRPALEAMDLCIWAHVLKTKVKKFNGEFFRNRAALPLGREQIGELRLAGRMPPPNLYARVRISLCELHTRPRVRRAPGPPCALFSEGVKFPENLAQIMRRDREAVRANDDTTTLVMPGLDD